MRESTRTLFLGFVALLCFGPEVFADSNTSGWTWGVNCASSGTFGNANFTAATTGGFSGSGTCARTSTQFTQFTFTSTSGGTTNYTTNYGLNTGDLLIVPPTLSTETEPIFTVQPYCPVANATMNWIFVQWGSSWNAALGSTNTVIGAAAYNTSSGLSITGEYNVTGGTVYSGSGISLPGTCSNGVYTTSGSGDEGGTLYLTASAGGVYKTGPGHAAFFFPQYTTTLSTDLGSADSAWDFV